MYGGLKRQQSNLLRNVWLIYQFANNRSSFGISGPFRRSQVGLNEKPQLQLRERAIPWTNILVKSFKWRTVIRPYTTLELCVDDIMVVENIDRIRWLSFAPDLPWKVITDVSYMMITIRTVFHIIYPVPCHTTIHDRLYKLYTKCYRLYEYRYWTR